MKFNDKHDSRLIKYVTLGLSKRPEPDTAIVWLMPITGEEDFNLKEEGWSKFKDNLTNESVNFWDLNRACCEFVRDG